MSVFWFKFDWIISQESDWQASIDVDSGLAPNRWHVITWTSDGLVDWCIYLSHNLHIRQLACLMKINFSFDIVCCFFVGESSIYG